jgi:serine/threonine-protein kinase
MLYEMLTGRVPFSGSIWEVMRDHCEKPPIPPSIIRRDLDPKLDPLCLKALAKAPGERYASAKDFATALANYLLGQEANDSGEFPPVETGPSAKSTNPNANTATSEILDLPGPESPSRSKGVPRAEPVPQPLPAEKSSRRRSEPPPPASRSRSRMRSRREREPQRKSMSPAVLVGIIVGIVFAGIVFFMALAMLGYMLESDEPRNDYPNKSYRDSDWPDLKEKLKSDFDPNNKPIFPSPPPPK